MILRQLEIVCGLCEMPSVKYPSITHPQEVSPDVTPSAISRHLTDNNNADAANFLAVIPVSGGRGS